VENQKDCLDITKHIGGMIRLLRQ